MKKLLVTGCDGFLGSRIAKYYDGRYQVLCAGHSALNIENEESVRRYVDRERPDIAVHCAAISDTGYAQAHPEQSYQVNVAGTKHMAAACSEVGAKLIFMSSDQIYNGCSIAGEAYDSGRDACIEGVDDRPASVYARHKLLAEQESSAANPDTVCLRLSWMFDLPIKGMKTNRNLLWNILCAAKESRRASFAVWDYRGVTWARDVVEHLEKTFTFAPGVYNFGCSNSLSSYETALEAAKLLGVGTDCIQKDDVRFLERPRNITMSQDKTENLGVYFTNAEDSIKRCILYYK